MTKTRTTFTITPEHTQQLDRLAQAMGFVRTRRGNVSAMLRHLADLTQRRLYWFWSKP